jgi:hypothetical protein
MKKLLFVIWFGIVFFVSSAPSYAGFLIQLKNGRTIYTEDYRIEGDQILLFLESGVVNISRGEVQTILQDTREIEEEKKGPPEKLEEKIIQKDRVSGKADIESYRKRKRELQERLNESKKVYFDAANKNEKDEARKIMLSISKELFELQKEVLEKNNGVIPKWWRED